MFLHHTKWFKICVSHILLLEWGEIVAIVRLRAWLFRLRPAEGVSVSESVLVM